MLNLASIGCEQVLIGLVQLLLRFNSLVSTSLRCSRHSDCAETIVVGVGGVIEAVLDLFEQLRVVKSLLIEVSQVALQLVRGHQLGWLCSSFLTLRVP